MQLHMSAYLCNDFNLIEIHLKKKKSKIPFFRGIFEYFITVQLYYSLYLKHILEFNLWNTTCSNTSTGLLIYTT